MLAAMVPLLELSALRVTRGATAILRGVSWRVGRAENWVILGANGSGKTTLLKALTGYMPPTSGDISLLGSRYGETDWRELRLHVGVVMSAFVAAVPPAEVALETVVSGKYAQLDLWHAGTPADRRAARRLLNSVGLGYLAEREWAYLSQGERQRVLIARALMARPQLLILDEPCAGLDPVAREKFLRFVNGLGRKRGAPALILVTHHVEEIMPTFTHALMIRRGAVLAAGRCAQVLTSQNLSATFRAPMQIRRVRQRYQLAFAKGKSRA
jgi:iron complex transport system ATP-binding protein